MRIYRIPSRDKSCACASIVFLAGIICLAVVLLTGHFIRHFMLHVYRKTQLCTELWHSRPSLSIFGLWLQRWRASSCFWRKYPHFQLPDSARSETVAYINTFTLRTSEINLQTIQPTSSALPGITERVMNKSTYPLPFGKLHSFYFAQGAISNFIPTQNNT
jgi:hypothetical protein